MSTVPVNSMSELPVIKVDHLLAAPPVPHKAYCFAGQPSPALGYFLGDVLPCVCGAKSKLVAELAAVEVDVDMFVH